MEKICTHDVTIQYINEEGKAERRCLGCQEKFSTLSSLNSHRQQQQNKRAKLEEEK